MQQTSSKKLLALVLAFFMAALMLPLPGISPEPAPVQAASYDKITLNVPWYCQRRYGDCGISSVAMVEAYVKGYGPNNNTVYNAVWNKNNQSITLSSYANLGYSTMTNSYANIYNELKAGRPVIVYRTGNSANHFSVIYGYNGSTTSLEAKGFLVLNTYHNNDYTVFNEPGSFGRTNFASWLGSCTWKHTLKRTSDKIPLASPDYSNETNGYFSQMEVKDLSETDATIYGYLNSLTSVKGDGFYIGTSADKLTKITKNLAGAADPASNSKYFFFKMSKWYGKLAAGTKYYYQIYYLDSNGTERKSPVNWFITKGTAAAPTNCTLKSDSVRIPQGGSITFTASATGATGYDFYVRNVNQDYYNSLNATGSQATFTCYETGLYEAYADCKGANESVSTNLVFFRVVSDTPTPVRSTTYGDHTYTFYVANLTWTDANDWCRNNGGYLMTITSEDEQYCIEQLLGDHINGACWLGAYRGEDDAFHWVTDEEWGYENWRDGEPNNKTGTENYVGSYNSVKWNDSPNESDYVFGFIMETGEFSHEHVFGSGLFLSEPTCTEDGSYVVECMICGLEMTEIYPALGHDYGDFDEMSDMYHSRTCLRCGERFSEEHTWDIQINGNEISYTCLVCGYHTVNVIGGSETDASLTVSETSGAAGKEVSVEIRMENNPGIVNMMLSLHYDPLLTLVKVEDGGILGANMHPSNYQKNPYPLSWVNDTASENFTADGTLATLTFRIADEAEDGSHCAVWLDYDSANMDIVDVNASPVDFRTCSGYVQVISSVPGDVNMDGSVNTLDRMILARYLAKWDGYEEQIADWNAADINKDGTVNTLDRMILARYLAKWDGYESYFM